MKVSSSGSSLDKKLFKSLDSRLQLWDIARSRELKLQGLSDNQEFINLSTSQENSSERQEFINLNNKE